MLKSYRIDNSSDSAVKEGKWNPNTAELIKTANSSHYAVRLIHEIFLISPDCIDTQPNTTNCKYPHHEFSGNRLVLSVPGVKAAYARAKQTGEYDRNEELRDHLDRHRRELGLEIDEKKQESSTAAIDKAFALLQEAMKANNQEKIQQSNENSESHGDDRNLFDQMFERPQANPVEGGAPLQPNQTQQQPTQPTAQTPSPAMNTGLNSGTQNAGNPATIPVTNVNPQEDTLTNNPIEGPDTRDQDNLDGNQRKEAYQQFANVMVEANSDNVFGTIFEEDVFKSEYKIVPYEMRYFYRLQNPVSVEVDDLRFIPFGTELLDAQEKYDLGKKMFVFATYSEKPIFFNMLDKTIWYQDDKVADTFDAFIDSLVQSKGVFTPPGEQETEERDANVQFTQDPGTTDQTDTPDSSGMNPIDLGQSTDAQQGALNTGLGDQGPNMTTPDTNTGADASGMAPIDLNAPQQANATPQTQPMNASYDPENDSILNDLMIESVAFPNDALDKLNRQRAMEDLKRRRGTYFAE